LGEKTDFEGYLREEYQQAPSKYQTSCLGDRRLMEPADSLLVPNIWTP